MKRQSWFQGFSVVLLAVRLVRQSLQTLLIFGMWSTGPLLVACSNSDSRGIGETEAGAAIDAAPSPDNGGEQREAGTPPDATGGGGDSDSGGNSGAENAAGANAGGANNRGGEANGGSAGDGLDTGGASVGGTAGATGTTGSDAGGASASGGGGEDSTGGGAGGSDPGSAGSGGNQGQAGNGGAPELPDAGTGGNPIPDAGAPEEPEAESAYIPEPALGACFGIDDSDRASNVLLHSGELRLARTDLAVRGRSLGFVFSRTYRSGNHDDGPLGTGWDADVFARIEVEPDTGDALFHDGSGRHHRFERSAVPNYDSPAGVFSRLRDATGGGFELRAPDGTLSRFDDQGRLTSLRTRLGDIRRYVYTENQLSEVRDEFDRAYTFAYDGESHLTTVTDFEGREVQFTYDAGGRLGEVRSPRIVGTVTGHDVPDGKRELYRYEGGTDPDLASNLVAIIAPREVADGSFTPFLQAEYGSAGTTRDRVVRQTLGNTGGASGETGGTFELSYAFDETGGRTTVVDRAGHSTVYDHDPTGRCVAVEESLAQGSVRTTMRYDDEGRLLEVERPLGNRELWSYDTQNPSRFQQGNVLEARLEPDPIRGGTTIRTTYRYEPLFNQLRTVTSPRGLDPNHVPANGGDNSPERYTHRFTFDWQESDLAPEEALAWDIFVPAELFGLGDRDGDGRTDQARGQVVRADAPTVALRPGSQQATAEGDPGQEVTYRISYNDFGQRIRVEDARGNVDTYSYYPAADPDGDGDDSNPEQNDETGGYLQEQVIDAELGPRRTDPGAPVAKRSVYGYDALGRVTEVTNPLGHTWRYDYDAGGRLLRTERPRVDPNQAHGFRTELQHDENDKVIAVRVENWVPNPETRVPELSTTHPFFEHRLVRDLLDRIVEVQRDATRPVLQRPSTSPEQLVTRLEYDANGNLLRELSPAAVSGAQPNNRIEHTYDARNLRVATRRGGESTEASTIRFEYDANGNLVRAVDALGAVEETQYDGQDRAIAVVDRAGNRLERLLDAEGRLLQERWLGPVSDESTVPVLLSDRRYAYDELGRLIQQDTALFLPAGVVLDGDLPLLDGPLSPGDALLTERYEYDALGRPTFRTEDDGGVYSFVHDGADRQIVQRIPLSQADDPAQPPAEARYSYDAEDNVVTLTETRVHTGDLSPPPVEARTHMVYDTLNRVVRLSDPKGQTRYRDYDSRDHIVATYDARGEIIADPLGIVEIPINAPGNARRYLYDGAGRRWQRTFELRAGGDSQGQLEDSPGAPGGLLHLSDEWDEADRLVRRGDSNGNPQSYVYDSLDRIVAQENADSGLRTYQYDPNDNPTRVDDENGSVHDLAYDVLDRLIAHDILPAGTVLPSGVPMLVGTTRQEFGYDGASRLTLAFDGNDPADDGDDTRVRVRYDSVSRVVEEQQGSGAVGSGYVADSRTDLRYPGGSRTVHYRYDAHGQFVGLSNPTSLSCSISRQTSAHDCCPCKDCTTPGTPSTPTKTTWETPDPVTGELTETLEIFQDLDENMLPFGHSVLTDQLPGSFHYERNRNDEVTSMQLIHERGDFQLQLDNNQSTDSLDRPVQGNTNLVAQESPGGNPNVILSDSSSESRTLGAGQETLQREVSDVTGTTVESRSYNEVYERTDGNYQYNGSPGTGIRTADDRFVYQWDGLNRLRTVRLAEDPDQVLARYTYDAFPGVLGGRRVRKEVSGLGELDSTTEFVWDGGRIIEDRIVSNGTSRVARQFLHEDSHHQPLAMDVDTDGDGDPDELLIFAHDHLGSVLQLLSAEGEPVESYAYDLYGEGTVVDPVGRAVLERSQFGNPFQFTGQQLDEETGYYYLRARYYDPKTGEFLSRDPTGAFGDPDNLGNPMAYVANNPLNRTDPSGLGNLFTEAAEGVWIIITSPSQGGSLFAEAWNERYVEPMVNRACTVMEATESETMGYVWVLADFTGVALITEAMEGQTVEGHTLSTGDRLLRGGFGYTQAILTYTGVRGSFVPRGGKAPTNSLWSYTDDAARGTNFSTGGNRIWTTPHKPGPWLYEKGFKASAQRFLRTGRCRPYQQGQMTAFLFEGESLALFRPVRHGLIWKSVGQQHCTQLGINGIRGIQSVPGVNRLFVVLRGSGQGVIRGGMTWPRLGPMPFPPGTGVVLEAVGAVGLPTLGGNLVGNQLFRNQPSGKE